MRLHIVVPSLLVAATWCGLGEAQSLAALAKDSSKGRKTSAKVYTDADLRAARGRLNYVEIESAEETEPAQLDLSGDLGFDDSLGEGESVSAPAEPSEEEARAQRLAELRKRLDEENKVIAAVQKAMQEAQTELNDLTSLTFGARRAYLAQIVEDGLKEIAKSQETIAGLEEQARRNGFNLSR